MKRKNLFALFVICLLPLLIFLSCTSRKGTEESKANPSRSLILATTTSTQDTGLLDKILPLFEKRYNVKMKPVAVGTGEAIAMGKKGEADVLLVHSREAEDKFMEDGYGKVRKDVMYNDFVVVGPSSDSASIKGLDAISAFKGIAESKSSFVSRGDESGTYKKEKKIWEKAGITPSGDWYMETGQGMGETLRVANEKVAYTLVDRGTYLSQQKTVDSKVLVEKDKILFNPYGVIAVDPQKFPKVNYSDAIKFINWITSYETQEIIAQFGKDKYGQALFIPASSEWKAKLKH